MFRGVVLCTLLSIAPLAFGHGVVDPVCEADLSVQVLGFVSGLQDLRPGERNVFVLSYYQSHRDELSLAMIKQLLVYGLVDAGPMPSHAPYFKHMSRPFVESQIVGDLLRRHYKSWGSREVIWILDLVQDEATRQSLRAQYPPEKLN